VGTGPKLLAAGPGLKRDFIKLRVPPAAKRAVYAL